MTNNEILIKVVDVFAPMADTEDEITEESELIEDLGISSMDVLFLVSSLEAEFKVKVPQKLVRKMVTIGDVVEILESLIQ